MKVVVVALLAGACAMPVEPDARAVAERFVAAVESGDHDMACALLSPRAATECVPDLPTGAVYDVQVWGDDSIAWVGSQRMYLHRFSEGWRITGAGCEGEARRCVVGGP